MPFQMSLKALIEEDLIELKCVCDRYVNDVGEVIKALHENETLDHKNDELRLETREFLLSAVRAFTMRDYEGSNNHVHAALQRMAEQERLDLDDDNPRYRALVALSVLQEKLIRCSQDIRGHLGRLNGKDETKSPGSETVSLNKEEMGSHG